VNAHEISIEPVYRDANVTVTAFTTKHAMECYGYQFVTPHRTTVLSGDTSPSLPTFQRFAAKYHTTTAQLADLARQAQPRLLIIYHHPTWPEDVFADMSARFEGGFVVCPDLDIF
jgi:ribonuclease BN (tRNA processing enzyme)